MNLPQPIPMAPGGLPALGHVGPLLRDPGAFLTGLPAHGELVRIRFGPATMIMICDAEMTRQVLLDDRTFDRGGPLFDKAREITGGLGTCPYHEHRRQRRLVQPAFHHARLPEYARVMAAQIAATTETWHDGQILDVLSESEDLGARILAANLFSDKLAPSEVRQITRDINTITKGIYVRMLLPPLNGLPTPGNIRYHRALTRLRDTTDRVVTERRAGGADRGDLLSALLTHDPEDADHGLSDAEIHDQVLTFLIAGTETTAALVAWALHLVATHPDIEERLHTELDTVLGGEVATYDDLPRLELTGRIIAETLRLYPALWLMTRAVTCDTRLANHAIPAGTTIAVSPFLLHRQGDLFDRPGEFDPDRWLPERAATIPRSAYLPFGAGARKCIGNDYGLVQGALALSAVAAHWRLQPLPGQSVRPTLSNSVRPRRLRMRAVARTPARTASR